MEFMINAITFNGFIIFQSALLFKLR